MKKRRPDFKEERNEKMYRAKTEGGLSYNDIAKNPNYNPKGLTVQRVEAIVKDWAERLEKEKRS